MYGPHTNSGPMVASKWCCDCAAKLDNAAFNAIANKDLSLYRIKNMGAALSAFFVGLSNDLDFNAKVQKIQDKFGLDAEEALEVARDTRRAAGQQGPGITF